MIDLEGFTERIENFYNDVRTEVLVAELLQEGLNPDDITIIHAGQHKRSFRRDLDEAFAETKKDQGHIVFKLNRDSIYDSLPESLFHQPKVPQNGLSVKNMIDGYRKRKQEEKEARSFFAPLENEFFLQKSFIELLEKELLQKLSNNDFDDYFLSFFNIPVNLPKELLSKFMALLPYRSKFIGNLPLTFLSLELILEESVKYKLKDATINKYSNAASLSEINLGVDFILGDFFYPDDSKIEVTIGPVKKENLKKYLDNSPQAKFIETYFNFFLPVDIDIETIFEVNKEEQNFYLDGTEENFRLGYTTRLLIAEV